jgi:urease accessory protein
VEQHTQLVPSAVKGRLHLKFVYHQERQSTQLAISEQQAPLQVIRAFPLDDRGALVHLHNLSGGILGGDQLTLSVEVGAGAHAQLTSTSATRIYRSRPEMLPAHQKQTVLVRQDALLEYLPDPLIPFAGSRYHQHTHITLEPGAGLFWWEVITPGRVARNEIFAYDLLQMDLLIADPCRPIAMEAFKLEPRLRALSSPARLGAYYYTCSFYICRVGLAPTYWSNLEQDLSQLALQLTRPGEINWGVSTLVAHGLIIRAVSKQGHTITSGLQAFWNTARLALYGQAATPPRKIY